VSDRLVPGRLNCWSKGVVRIEADADRCEQVIEKSLAMTTALAPRIGYDNAAAIAKAAYQKGKTIREVALELVGLGPEQVASRLGPPTSSATLAARGGFPSGEDLEKLLDPLGQTIRRTGSNGGASA
jgi:fumarate hydratase class II